MLANEPPRFKQDWTSWVTAAWESDLNFTTSCPGTTVKAPDFLPRSPVPGGGADCAPLDLDDCAEALWSTADSRLVFSEGSEEAQPPDVIALAVANSSRRERPLPTFGRIIFFP